jgi:tetratricopeptide (TPR) repeat protein
MTLSQSHAVFLIVIAVVCAALTQGTHAPADDSSPGHQLPVSPTPATTNAPVFATTIDNQAEPPMETNLLAETERNYRRALAIDERSLGPDHILVANRIIDLAVLLHNTNRLAEAEPLYRRALEISEKNLGFEHPTVAVALNNLAMLLLATDRFAEAERLMRRALAIDERTVAVRLNNLALLLQSTRRVAEAELLYRRALAIDEKNFSPNHPSVGIALTNLALLLKTTNRVAEAESLIRRASALREQQNGSDHTDDARLGKARFSRTLNEPRRPSFRSSLAPQDRKVELAKSPDLPPVAAVLVALRLATDVRAPPPRNKPEEQPVERATSPTEAAVVTAPSTEASAISASQKEIEERPIAALADVAVLRAPLASDVPAAAPQNKPEEQPTERRVANSAVRAPVVDVAPAAASVRISPPDRKPEGQPVERTKTPTEAAAGTQKEIKERSAGRTGDPGESPVARGPIASGTDASAGVDSGSRGASPGTGAAGVGARADVGGAGVSSRSGATAKSAAVIRHGRRHRNDLQETRQQRLNRLLMSEASRR